MTQTLASSPLAVDPEEAGRMSGHSRTAIYKAIAEGELKAFKSGRRRLILTTEIQNWLNRLAKVGSR